MKKADVSVAALEALEERKRQSALQLLLKASRLVNERAVARMQSERASSSVRLSHTRLLPHLDFEGTRITELAERTGVTKQAVAKMIDELEEEGVVRREPDPSDGRAKLVRLTKRGLAGIHQGLSILDGLEQELEGGLGPRAMQQLKTHLAALVELLDRD